jgi:hypothetical protein
MTPMMSIAGGAAKPVEIWREPDGSLTSEDQRVHAKIKIESDRSVTIVLTASEPFRMYDDVGASAH